MQPTATASAFDTSLPVPHRWRVAFGLVLLYYPVLVYLNYPRLGHSWEELGRALPSVGTGAVGVLLMFRAWIYTVEKLQDWLHKVFKEEFSLEMRWWKLSIIVALCIIISLGFGACFGTTMRAIDTLLIAGGWTGAAPGNTTGDFALWRRSMEGYFMILLLSVFYLLANSRAQQRVREISFKTQQLETENAQVQLAALKSQVNPHFLFNSLSILSSLVHVDADLSEQFIEQLSRAYRYTLEQQDHDIVPLETELAFIESYSFLLKIRFEDKFTLTLDVPGKVRTTRYIAPLTLQLLVENAVKHNTMSLAKPLRVSVCLDGDDLVVRNSLQRRPATYASTGVGLQNIRNRYRLLSKRPVQVSEEDGAFMVRIPLLSP